MTSQDYTNRMDAEAFWNQFPADWRPEQPGETILGTVDWYGERKSPFDEGPVPVVRVKLDNGDLVNIVASQTMLLVKLKRCKPARGDRIKVMFDGVEPSTNPRVRPAHRYLVAVRDGVVEKGPEE